MSLALTLSPVIEVPPLAGEEVRNDQAELARRRFMPTYTIGSVDLLSNHDVTEDDEEEEEGVMRESVRQNAQRVEDVELTISEAVGVVALPEADGLLRRAIEDVGFALFDANEPGRNGRMICSYAFAPYFDIENRTGFSLSTIHQTHLPPDAADKVRRLQDLLEDYQHFIVQTENARADYERALNDQIRNIYK